MLFISIVKSNRTLKSNEPPSWQLVMILRLIFMLFMCLYIEAITIHGTYKHKRILQNECSIYDQVYYEGVSSTLTVKKL